jgi:pyocin large subunit-like protein
MGGRGTGTAGPSPAARFPDLTREGHFRRHGTDFGARSAEHYESLAASFAARRHAAGVESFVSRDGFVFMYEAATNTFLLQKPGGELVTFYKPTPVGYWQTQRSKYEPT